MFSPKPLSPGAKHVFKKHQLLESEINSHEDIIICLLKKLDGVSDDSIFKDEVSGARERLDKDWKSLKKLSQEKNKKIREFVYFLKVNYAPFPFVLYDRTNTRIQ